MQSAQVTTLGQYPHHGVHDGVHGAQTVNATEVANELISRGYQIYVAPHIPPPHHIPPHEPPALTRGQAIAIAVDVSIEAYNIVHTTTHPYQCPSPMAPDCSLTESMWNTVVGYGVTLANYYLGGGALPGWAGIYPDAGLDEAYYGDMGEAYYGDMGSMYGLGGFMDWITENPEILTILGAAITAAGAALTARRVKELLEANIPKDYLTKADLPALLQALSELGTAGQLDALSAGAQAATMPAWGIPAIIGGGLLIVMLMLRK